MCNDTSGTENSNVPRQVRIVDPAGAHLYRTTGLFLEKLGLDTVDQLPPLAPFLPDNVEEIADADR